MSKAGNDASRSSGATSSGEARPAEPEKPKSGLASKPEQWLGLKDDGGDLYQDTIKRLQRGKE